MLSVRGSKKFLPGGLQAEQIEVSGDEVLVRATPRWSSAVCPTCGRTSRRVHSRYQRRLADLPAHGRRVSILLSVRRFRCVSSDCRTGIFAERLDHGVTRPYARRTSRMQDLVRHLGRALGGRSAQALADRLLLPVSKDTILRSVRAVSGGQVHEDLRVIGIDDWAWRRGQRYGTLICDLERRKVVDILPDREPATVEAWLRDRPQIEVVARDRNGGYGGAVSRALPEAVQVADRWHLLENSSAAFLSAVRRAMPAIRQAVAATTLDPDLQTRAERIQYEGFLRRQQTNVLVRQMAREGTPIKRIVRTTGLSRQLVRQILRGEREDIFRVRQSSLERWLPWLEREWDGGCHNAAELWRRLRAVGFAGSLRVVGEWAIRQRRAEAATTSATGRCPPARRIARMMTTARDHLSTAGAVTVARIEAAIPGLAAARVLIDRFVTMTLPRCRRSCWLAGGSGEQRSGILRQGAASR